MIDNNKLSAFAEVVVADLVETERAIDDSLSKASILLNTLVNGRIEAGLPAQVGQYTLQKLGAAINSAIEYRSNMVLVHRSLEAAASKMGVTYAAGPFEPKPDDGSKHKPIFSEAETF